MFRYAAVLACFALPAAAQEACSVEGDKWDLDDAAVTALYDCMQARMIEGYTKGDNAWAAEYREWNATASRPAVAGAHGERFLYTFVNDVAAEQYLAFEQGEFEMPVGSILAKETMAVREGTGRVGPLFFMEKVADAPDTDGWVYSGVQPNGKALKISQSFCHDCHAAFEDQDSMGYPVQEVRLTN
ncbi:MAG: cytochrome P460 family protein [Pseudomonadota bacterium]